MRDHSDLNGANPPLSADSPPSAPQFEVLQEENLPDIVIVVSTSELTSLGSASHIRQSLHHLITILPNGARVGLVTYDSLRGSVVANLTRVGATFKSREPLYQAIPTQSGSGTTLSERMPLGVAAAMDMLEADSLNAGSLDNSTSQGAAIIVLTANQLIHSDAINMVQTRLDSMVVNVQFYPVLFQDIRSIFTEVPRALKKFEQLATPTGGRAAIVPSPSSNEKVSFTQVLASILQDVYQIHQAPSQLYYEEAEIELSGRPRSTHTTSVAADNSIIGGQLFFAVTWTIIPSRVATWRANGPPMTFRMTAPPGTLQNWNASDSYFSAEVSTVYYRASNLPKVSVTPKCKCKTQRGTIHFIMLSLS